MDEGSLWAVTSITCAHYEALKAAGQPIPGSVHAHFTRAYPRHGPLHIHH